MIDLDKEWHPPRRLRVFAFDPTTARAYANRDIREVTISLPWEMDPKAGLGPSGAYLEIIDHDPASQAFYRPIDLNDPRVLAGDGLDPAEEDPQFHQQMVYAVAMNTIGTFEEALGRTVLWAPYEEKIDGTWTTDYVDKLRIFPHALREANAFYSPAQKALLFGYFEAGDESRGAIPGTTVFTCLSHDIVVHETVHAILDGLHPYYAEASHPDMLALHEAFADLVAIFQLFSFPQVLESQIARTGGRLENQSMLGQLAQEFGRTLGRSDALRSALGQTDPRTKEWRSFEPNRDALAGAKGPHARGSVLVAAVFRAFLNVYTGTTADLFRIASGGSGILREGRIDPDLTRRLAREAAKVARRVLRICIRAMDYTPPVAVSFGAYLRAIMTADHDLYPEDSDGYRTAFLEAFAAWGIVPEDLPVVTETTVLWPTLSQTVADLKGRRGLEGLEVSIEGVKGSLGALITDPQTVFRNVVQRQKQTFDKDGRGKDFMKQIDRSRLGIASKHNQRVDEVNKMQMSSAQGTFSAPLLEIDPDQDSTRDLYRLGQAPDRETEFHIRALYSKLVWMLTNNPEFDSLAHVLGLSIDRDAPASVRRSKITGRPSMHVLPVRRARRVGRRSTHEDEYVIEIVQTRYGFFDPDRQAKAEVDKVWAKTHAEFLYRAGCTLLVDAEDFTIRRLIRTRWTVEDPAGLADLRRTLDPGVATPRNAFDAPEDHSHDPNAFAVLHRHDHGKDHG